MKNLLSFIIVLCILISCKKDSTNEPTIAEVIYEVTLSNSASWNGAYLNEKSEMVSVSNGNNNWTYKFKNVNNLCCLSLAAWPNGSNINKQSIMKIYVNGKLVAQGTSTGWTGMISYNF